MLFRVQLTKNYTSGRIYPDDNYPPGPLTNWIWKWTGNTIPGGSYRCVDYSPPHPPYPTPGAPYATYVATGDSAGVLRIWNATTGTYLRGETLSSPLQMPYSVKYCESFLHNPYLAEHRWFLIATGGGSTPMDKEVRVHYDTESQVIPLTNFTQHTNNVRGVSWARNGTILVSCSDDGHAMAFVDTSSPSPVYVKKVNQNDMNLYFRTVPGANHYRIYESTTPDGFNFGLYTVTYSSPFPLTGKYGNTNSYYYLVTAAFDLGNGNYYQSQPSNMAYKLSYSFPSAGYYGLSLPYVQYDVNGQIVNTALKLKNDINYPTVICTEVAYWTPGSPGQWHVCPTQVPDFTLYPGRGYGVHITTGNCYYRMTGSWNPLITGCPQDIPADRVFCSLPIDYLLADNFLRTSGKDQVGFLRQNVGVYCTGVFKVQRTAGQFNWEQLSDSIPLERGTGYGISSSLLIWPSPTAWPCPTIWNPDPPAKKVKVTQEVKLKHIIVDVEEPTILTIKENDAPIINADPKGEELTIPFSQKNAYTIEIHSTAINSSLSKPAHVTATLESGSNFKTMDLALEEGVPIAITNALDVVVSGNNDYTFEAFGPWSSMVKCQWDFGNGYVAEGTMVAHKFANPGMYAIEVSVRDVQNNTLYSTTLVLKVR